jgi:hypothetical protein
VDRSQTCTVRYVWLKSILIIWFLWELFDLLPSSISKDCFKRWRKSTYFLSFSNFVRISYAPGTLLSPKYGTIKQLKVPYFMWLLKTDFLIAFLAELLHIFLSPIVYTVIHKCTDFEYTQSYILTLHICIKFNHKLYWLHLKIHF